MPAGTRPWGLSDGRNGAQRSEDRLACSSGTKDADRKNCGQSHTRIPSGRWADSLSFTLLRWRRSNQEGFLKLQYFPPVAGTGGNLSARFGHGWGRSFRVAHRVQTRRCQRDTEAKSRAFPFRRFKFHRAVMPLQNLVRLRQPNAAAILLGRKVKLKNLVLHIVRNTTAPVTDLGHGDIVFTVRRDCEQTSLRHSLYSVQYHVEQGLLHQIRVHLEGKRLTGQGTFNGDAVVFCIRGGE